ncbi:uncharacterized protein G2W53_004492 [Senna tora]|uniref:Uncharacterized protein n=1 Tax=Senna tora TaxID=362788 RepID=A0A834XD98_9FABA|nr:uncharacterized protein G2W53_004492 [Senna tora]
MVRREGSKHGKPHSTDRSGSSSIHKMKSQGGSKEGDTKKSYGKSHLGR